MNIRYFCNQNLENRVNMEKKIPFELGLPSDDLIQRAENLKNETNVSVYSSSEEAFKELGI